MLPRLGEFKVPSLELVTLKVYDLLGREVAAPVNEELQPGSYEVTWEAIGLSSGVYFYRLQAHPTDGGQDGEFIDTKKLLLLK